jgi:hypothetical protein
MAERDGDQIVETTIEARGAERGPTVRNVYWSEPWLGSGSFCGNLFLVF